MDLYKYSFSKYNARLISLSQLNRFKLMIKDLWICLVYHLIPGKVGTRCQLEDISLLKFFALFF